MADARVALDPILDAFGVPATVTRPAPDNTPVVTTGFWVLPLNEEQLPVGVELNKRDPRRVFVMAKNAALNTLPTNTLISAPEELGDAPKLWRVDGRDRVESDCWRAIVLPARTI